jgi:acetyl-CoA carboxylase carboxyl transferase subunit alpha
LTAEEHNQAEAIAVNLLELAGLKVPVVSVVTGEGGSGGALAIGLANRVLMLEHSVYSVISPEGCASILWKTAEKAMEAAQAMRITAREILELGVIDGVIDEPLRGAHHDADTTAANAKAAILNQLKDLMKMSAEEVRNDRQAKFRAIGAFNE